MSVQEESNSQSQNIPDSKPNLTLVKPVRHRTSSEMFVSSHVSDWKEIDRSQLTDRDFLLLGASIERANFLGESRVVYDSLQGLRMVLERAEATAAFIVQCWTHFGEVEPWGVTNVMPNIANG